MVGRIGKLVRRQQSGNYVVQALLKRMSGRKDIASKIMDELIEEIRNGNLVEQSEMSEKKNSIVLISDWQELLLKFHSSH